MLHSAYFPEKAVTIAPASRRVKLLRVSADLLLNILFSPQAVGAEIRIIGIEGIPDGARVQAVGHDHHRDQFLFRLEHESFPEVAEGHHITELSVNVYERRVRIAPDDDNRGYKFI